jgi:membrane-bound lytic murein transglycosylase B
MKSIRQFIAAVSLIITLLSPVTSQASEPFGSWLAGLYEEAVKAGISQSVLDEALGDIEPVSRVIELDRKQPEKKMTFAEYRRRVINDRRIRKGREMLYKYRHLLAKVEQKYGVAPKYIVALWGIETSYGENTGGFEVIPALATLAWEGRRGEFFKKELLEALRIIDQGHINFKDMSGSWAGAMGQNQFMPSSFHNFAVDFNGDGHKDIWNDKADVFASTANYLATNGWKADERWGRRVLLPSGFNSDLIGLDHKMALSEWRRIGVKKLNNAPIPVVKGMKGSLAAPDGIGGQVFLVYDNYRVLMTWNRSTYFASAVGLLADAISG